MKKTTKGKPTREQLAALASMLADAPAIGNDAQARIWDENGGAQGWAALDAKGKAAFRERLKSVS